MKNIATEHFFRFVQHCFSSFLFDAPVLSACKSLVYRSFIEMGRDSYVSHGSVLVSPHTTRHCIIQIGQRVGIEHHCIIDYSGGLIIEDDVWISEGSLIATHDHRITTKALKKDQPVDFTPLKIGKDAWIGANAVILSHVRYIGKGAVIGASSVVTKDVPDWAIVVGNPSRIIGYRD